jgi:hypothetical protein
MPQTHVSNHLMIFEYATKDLLQIDAPWFDVMLKPNGICIRFHLYNAYDIAHRNF